MNVSLAAQTLSGSVADAIDFMNVVLKQPEFQNSEATVSFTRIMDRLCLTQEIHNSRNPHGKAFQKPLTLFDMSGWQATLESTVKYLLTLKSSDEVPVIYHPRKTFVFGICDNHQIHLANDNANANSAREALQVCANVQVFPGPYRASVLMYTRERWMKKQPKHTSD